MLGREAELLLLGHCSLHRSNVKPLLGQLPARRDIEAGVIDWPAAGAGSLVLHKQHDAAGLGAQVFFVMRIGMMDHRPRREAPTTDRAGLVHPRRDLRDRW